ncbi:MAG: SPOR domain-containing protein [Bacteroidota bacterium]|nr:SPOR domain-containing protein [Bacteroidota bacterium]
MRNISNEERLRILKERLDQIQQKSGDVEASVSPIQEKSEEVNINTLNNNNSSPKRKNKLPLLFLIAILLYTGYYIYTNITPPYHNNIEEEIFEEETAATEEAVTTEEIMLEYTFNFGKKKHLIIINSFEDEESATGLVNQKIKNGYIADYFFLPDVSNSTDKIYQVYIGPFTTIEETNQWASTLEGKFDILSL